MWELSRQQIRRQRIGRQFYFKQNISRLKNKTGPGEIWTQDLRRPKHIRYLQAKLAWNVKQIEYIMNKVEKNPDESCGQSCSRKNLVPDCNTLAYCKSNYVLKQFKNSHFFRFCFDLTQGREKNLATKNRISSTNVE